MDWVVSTPRLDPIEYVRKPQVILRTIILVCVARAHFILKLFSIVVVSIIHTGCFIEGICLFNKDASACGFGLFIGSVAIVIVAIYLYLDILVDNIANLNTRKTLVLVDTILTGICCCFWFIAFCLLCNRWQNTEDSFIKKKEVSPSGPRTAIAFAFLSLLCSSILTYIAYASYKAIGALFINGPDINHPQSAYTTSPSNTGYHGFTQDTSMLDPNGPARLDTDSPHVDGLGQDYGNTNMGRTGGTYQGNLLSGF